MFKLINWLELEDQCLLILKKDFLNKLIKRRQKLNLTQIRLAKKIGLSRKFVQTNELGLTSPKVINLKRWLKGLTLSYDCVNKNINYIKTHNKKIFIKFPIKERSEHIQILSHAMFDGSKEDRACIRYKVRYDKPTKKLFKTLLIECFGKNCFGMTDNCYFLYKPLSQLLSNHYKIRDFHSKSTYYSNKIVNMANKNKDIRKSILKAALLDEGYVGYMPHKGEKCRITIVTSLKNKKLCMQLYKITKLNKYNVSIWKARNESEFTINVLKNSKRVFYDDIISILPKNYYKRILVEKAIKNNFI